MPRTRRIRDFANDLGMLPLLGVPPRGVIPRRIFRAKYPLSYALGFRPVSVYGNEHEAFDIDEVHNKLGTERFNLLYAGLKVVLSCGHRNWPADHPEEHKRNAEVHCVQACDLEAFLNREKVPLGQEK